MSFVSQGYNITGTQCAGNAPGDIASADPRLSPLSDNGDCGDTMMPQPTSAAADAGN